MDICNYAKVILTRATKDISSLQWWKKQNSENNRPILTDNSLNNNTNDNSDDNSNSLKKSYTSNFSLMERHQNYMMFMDGYPKMHVEYSYFKKRISRLQSYVTEKKYWKSGGKSEERNLFLDYFGLQNWYNLKKMEKQKHTLEKCNPCRTIHIDMSSLHKSLDKDSRQILETCQTATDHFIHTVSPTSMTQEKGVKIVKSFINIIQPIIEEKVNIKFNCKLADSLSPTAITAAEHRQEIKKAVTVSKKKFEEVMKDDGNDVTNFLSSGKSFNQYHRDRMTGFFESKVRAEERTEKLIRQESAGKKKSKQHHGNFENYSFDITGFLNEMTSKPSGSDINWTLMAKTYNLQINGKFPANAGQVILEYARKQGINTQTHNKEKRVSSRDYLRRIRRAKNTIYMRNKQHSLPTPRTGKAIKEDVKRKLRSGELYIGVKIAEKTKITTVISPEGELIPKTIQLFARKMPLTYIREQSLKDQLHQGLFKYTSDEEYDKMNLQLVKDKLFKLGLQSPETADQTRSLLKSTERTRKLKIWHDHSDILNHSYICFTVSFLYDEANFYTDQEFRLKHPDKKPINVQALVERPKLYIFGQSGSSDEEQTLYTRTRLEDLQQIRLPTQVTHDDHNLTVFDDLRVFSGDGPARQFKSGQQRGGNFSCLCGIPAVEHGNYVRCYYMKPLSLDERCQLATSTTSIRKLKQGILSPFQNLKKADLVKELKARNIETTDKDRKQLHEDLTQLLHGISRPPALMIPEPHLPTENINIPSYEILCTEPLHDLTNVIQNIIAELPYHIQDKEAQKEFQNFSQTTIGDKNQVKGSDARLYLVKLAKFAANLHEQKKIDKNTIQMIESLVEITNICYSKYECRSPKQILRLYNQCFLFAVTCRIVIGIPSNPKMSKRKFFGSHFHSVTVHLPECLRIFNLRSIVTEQEERIFGDLRRISENTTNRQAQFICDNAMLRFNSQQAAKTDYFTMQESVIQKQAHLLAPRPNSTIPAHIVTKQPTLLQAHLERIPDFLLSGNNIWWHSTNNNLIFHDGPDEPCYRNQGPEMSHFRSSSLKDENTKLKVIWQTIMTRFQENQLILPLRRLKPFDVYGNPSFVTVNKTEENDLEDEIQTPSCDIDTVRADDAIINEPENEEKKDSKSESTEDYIPDIPILQDQPEVPAIDHDRNQNNTETKEKYKSYIKVLRWSVQPSNIDVQGSLLIKPKQLPANNFKKQPTCKRKLFQSEVSNQEIASSRKKTTFDLVVQLLGPSSDVDDCIKYRKLKQKHPGHKSFISAFDQSFSKLQIEVSKRYFALKDEIAKDDGKENRGSLLADKEIAQKLLDHWGMYYF